MFQMDIEDVVLPSKQFGILNMETIDIKVDLLEQNNDFVSIQMDHERMNSPSFSTVSIINLTLSALICRNFWSSK